MYFSWSMVTHFFPLLPRYGAAQPSAAEGPEEAEKWGSTTQKWILKLLRTTDWEEFSQVAFIHD